METGFAQCNFPPHSSSHVALQHHPTIAFCVLSLLLFVAFPLPIGRDSHRNDFFSAVLPYRREFPHDYPPRNNSAEAAEKSIHDKLLHVSITSNSR